MTHPLGHPLLQTHFITRGQSLKQAQQVYRERRSALMKRCPFPMVIHGVPQKINANNPWLMTREPFYQDPLLFFLTGINQPGVSLLLNPLSDTQTERLLLPKKDREMAFWEGDQLGVGTSENEKEVTEITGIDHSDWSDNLWIHIEMIIKERRPKKIGIFWNESKKGQVSIKDYHYRFKLKLNRWINTHFKTIKVTNIAHEHYALRLPLDRIDIKHIKQANAITASTFDTILSELNTCSNEQDIHAIIAKETIKNTWMGYSFPPIIASGNRAQILHYQANNAPLDPNSLLLIDMGVRYETMPSDVTRTIPINGQFNPLQARLYTIVLEAQRLVESLVKPGVTIKALNSQCWKYIEKRLAKEIKAGDGTLFTVYNHAPHNVSHLISLSVHDGDPCKYQTQPLEPGMVISNEPGFYGDIALTIGDVRYKESIGIRIEDNLLVTKTGCKNITPCIKAIKDIEAALA